MVTGEELIQRKVLLPAERENIRVADVEFIGFFVVNQVENDLPQFRLNTPRRVTVSEETDSPVIHLNHL